MIPLSWMLLGWLAAVGLFLILALLTLIIHIKYAVSSFTTYAMTAVFLGVTVLVLFISANYIGSVDWSQEVDLAPYFAAPRITDY